MWKLNVKPSTLVSTITNESVGDGLFVKKNQIVKQNTFICAFKGKKQTEKDLEIDIQRNPRVQDYCIKLEDGNILNCYDHADSNVCLASKANSCKDHVVFVNNQNTNVKPNSIIWEIDGEVYLYCTRQINELDEIVVYTYNTEEDMDPATLHETEWPEELKLIN